MNKKLSSDAAEAIKAALRYNVSLRKSRDLRRTMSNLAVAMKNPLYANMKDKAMEFRKRRLDMPPDTANVIQIYQSMKSQLDQVEKNFNLLNDQVNNLILLRNKT
jgi:hypothetical protein